MREHRPGRARRAETAGAGEICTTCARRDVVVPICPNSSGKCAQRRPVAGVVPIHPATASARPTPPPATPPPTPPPHSRWPSAQAPPAPARAPPARSSPPPRARATAARRTSPPTRAASVDQLEQVRHRRGQHGDDQSDAPAPTNRPHRRTTRPTSAARRQHEAPTRSSRAPAPAAAACSLTTRLASTMYAAQHAGRGDGEQRRRASGMSTDGDPSSNDADAGEQRPHDDPPAAGSRTRPRTAARGTRSSLPARAAAARSPRRSTGSSPRGRRPAARCRASGRARARATAAPPGPAAPPRTGSAATACPSGPAESNTVVAIARPVWIETATPMTSSGAEPPIQARDERAAARASAREPGRPRAGDVDGGAQVRDF